MIIIWYNHRRFNTLYGIITGSLPAYYSWARCSCVDKSLSRIVNKTVSLKPNSRPLKEVLLALLVKRKSLILQFEHIFWSNPQKSIFFQSCYQNELLNEMLNEMIPALPRSQVVIPNPGLNKSNPQSPCSLIESGWNNFRSSLTFALYSGWNSCHSSLTFAL